MAPGAKTGLQNEPFQASKLHPVMMFSLFLCSSLLLILKNFLTSEIQTWRTFSKWRLKTWPDQIWFAGINLWHDPSSLYRPWTIQGWPLYLRHYQILNRLSALLFPTLLLTKCSKHTSNIVSEWVGFNVPPDTVYVISEMAFSVKIAHTHNNGIKSLTFTESLTFMRHKTQKNDLNLKL